ncbi:Phthiocerol synthesis polyketide synthase type I PpsC [Pigmentiphaga humi]|uniref:Phthiocerol synthesis polyketide synthase type I PpsC n=1 Tax=Pigmentiphaga humi TaxID=2478468 RepID=A0A3P4B5P5_9BURK|nr:NAD(P)H-quinone oxidoreductase [Pigmentiphaga humi]VCU71629.1 Phthiocerol synthesis polyketide synthase type I PpsC [Pigmentiphaga humi]
MPAIPQTMQAVHFRQPGGADVLEPVERPVPGAAAGEILIKVAAAGVNGPDLMQRRGLYPAPKGASELLGLEVSGEVVQVGARVEGWRVGDRVTALTNGGGYAQYCAVDARHALPIPEGVALADAAGLPEAYFTVWSNLFYDGGLRAGQTLLVHGGAGAVGSTAIRLAKAFGAEVVATDSPAERCDYCRSIGADHVVDYLTGDFVAEMRELGGADMILDIVGGPNIEKNFKAARHSARIVQLAFGAGSKVEIDLMPVMLKRLIYTGTTLRTRTPEYKAEVARQLREQVWPKFAQGAIQAQASHSFALAEAAAAHALMESRGHLGKILLIP